MDSIESDHTDDCTTGDTSPGSPDMDDMFGDPEILPRVGDQYQVSIPSLVTYSDGLQVTPSSTNVDATVANAHLFLMGLPIPIIWICDQTENNMLEGKNAKLEGKECFRDSDGVDTNETAEPKNCKLRPKNTDNRSSKVKVEALDVDYEKVSQKLPNGEAMVGNQMEQHEKYHLHHKFNGKGLFPVPGILGNSWSKIELESFLLGLYIFGKNLVQVKRFIESKEMGDILSYYYGKFYQSDRYRRWSECRKIRSRKSIHGQRIFTGWRQPELLSRLRPHIVEEGQNSLLEVSKAFGDGKITLEDYVFTLTAAVGTQNLIEAVGIGKGKQDLTGIMDPIKNNQVNPSRQEIPSGKDCNNLTSEDIVKYLTGDFRLSKARSNDLFWEAVWPRLLARGWHSEQPRSQRYAGAKNSLVFLIPGVKKFSRRRLKKGNQYFDCVSDVLNKVASDPKLIDVEVEAFAGSGSKELGCDIERKSEQNGPSDHQRHSYLKPRVSDCTSEIMKFTVVDTSLVHEEGPFKIRELRSLPVDTNTRTSMSEETAVVSSKEPMDKPVSLLSHQEDTNGSRPTNGISDSVTFTESLDCPVSVSKECMPFSGQGNTNSLVENHEAQSMEVCDDQSVRKTLKYQVRQRAKRGQPNGLAPVMKRRRLTACGRAEASRITNNVTVDSGLKEEEPCSLLESPNVSDNLDFAVGLSQEKVSTSSSAKASPDDSSEGIHTESCVGRVSCHDNAEPRTMIDLNLPPHVPLDFEAGVEMVDSPDDESARGSSDPSETIQPDNSQSLRTSNEIASEEEQPNVNARRQSTRNRPLSTKALEALASGYLHTKRKWRGVEPMARENSLARPSSRRVRSRVDVPTSHGVVATMITHSNVHEGVEEECSSSAIMQNNSLVPTERTRAPVLKPIYQSEVLAGKNNQPH